MGIKPIDLQTNMSHIGEVGKGEQLRNEAMINQQAALGGESNEKARLVNSRLEEAKKGEMAAIREQEESTGRRPGGKKRGSKKHAESKEDSGKPKYKDENLGNIIDVFK